MNNRELKHFHNENRTHVKTKELGGAEITADNAVNAPMGLKIYGASEQTAKYMLTEGGSVQTVTVQGDNLYNQEILLTYNGITKNEDGSYKMQHPNWYHNYLLWENTEGYTGQIRVIYTVKYENAVTEDGSIREGSVIAIGYTDGTSTWLNAGHSEETASGEFYTIDFTTPESKTVRRIVYSYSYGTVTYYKDVMVTKNISLTEYVPFVPDSPSPDYPAEITPTVTAGTYQIVLDDEIYEVTIPDMYSAGGASDKFTVDKLSKNARVKKEIDGSLLDFTKTIEENTQAIMTTPTYTELTLTKVDSSAAPFLPCNAYGDNLYNQEILLTYNGITKNEDGSYRVQHPTWLYNRILWENTEGYTGQIKIMFTVKYLTTESKRGLCVVCAYTDGTYKWLTANAWNEFMTVEFTSPADKTVKEIKYSYSYDTESHLKDVMVTKNTALTTYEPFDTQPPESLTPSEDYPRKIYPSSEIILKCTDGKTTGSTKIPLVGHAMEVSDFAKSNLTVDGRYYLAEIIEYDAKRNKAYRHKFIDDTLFDYTIPLKDQTQAILSEPTIEEIPAGDEEYSFGDVKSVQGSCTISTESYATDKTLRPNPHWLQAKIKFIK